MKQKLSSFFNFTPIAFDQNHRKLHWRLTLIFSVVILVIIAIYSGMIIASHNYGRKDFETDVNRQLPPMCVTTGAPTAPQPNIIIAQNFQKFENRTTRNLWLFDLLVWAFGSIIGYYLTGYLLRPSQKKTNEQLEFIGNASHELKTPIATIKTELVLLKNEKIDKKIANSLKVINDENNNLQNLVANLLAFNSSTSQNNLLTFNVSELINSKAAKYQKLNHKKNLAFIVTCPANLEIKSDPQKYAQILDLLMDNAGKYANAESEIKIIVTQKNSQLSLKITNQGLGIKDEDKERIFNRFYRVTDQKVQSQTGSGLGLSIAKQLAHDLHGELSLTDGNPEHTTFCFIINPQP